jgi:hypothetical protein
MLSPFLDYTLRKSTHASSKPHAIVISQKPEIGRDTTATPRTGSNARTAQIREITETIKVGIVSRIEGILLFCSMQSYRWSHRKSSTSAKKATLLTQSIYVLTSAIIPKIFTVQFAVQRILNKIAVLFLMFFS